MRRRATGQYRTISAASERFRAFVPMPLPPKHEKLRAARDLLLPRIMSGELVV
jgi:hypothetical protein